MGMSPRPWRTARELPGRGAGAGGRGEGEEDPAPDARLASIAAAANPLRRWVDEERDCGR